MKRLSVLLLVVAAGSWIVCRYVTRHEMQKADSVVAAPDPRTTRHDATGQSTPPLSLSSADRERAALTPPVAADSAVQAAAKALEQLVSRQTTPRQRQELLDRLRESGRIDEVIASLKQLASDNPGEAQIPLTLAEADIQKLRSIAMGGQGDPNDIAILGIQAEQNFQQALKLDPANWEAQFDRAAAMSHWPANLGKGPEVISTLSSLIDQQTSMAPQPEFAQTYLLLGQQYQVAGQSDKAVETYQRGAALYPTDSNLLKALSHGTVQ